MDIEITKELKGDNIVIGMFEGEKIKIIEKMIKKKEFSGKEGEIQILNEKGRRILIIGLGSKKDFNSIKLRRFSAVGAKTLRKLGASEFTTNLNLTAKGGTKAVTEGIILGLYTFDKYKTKKEKIIKKVYLLSGDKQAIKKGKIIAESMNYARGLTNEPGSLLTPKEFAEEAKKLAKKYKMKIRIFDKRELEKMGFGSLLAVASGSKNEPRFVVIEYPKGKERIVLVGKGVTFDSGGLDIKPAQFMDSMKNDKAGATTVLGILRAAAELKVKKHIIGLLPLTENMPGSQAYKPGDILRAYNKKTIEITHTDAEGRLILADALAYAEKFRPQAIIDIATLTGAVIVALGYEFAGVLGNNQKLIDKIKIASQKSDERIWQLPLMEEHKKNMESKVADVKNSHGIEIGPGAIYGAAFLQNFVKGPWAHIDIAGTAWVPKDTEIYEKGSTGYGVSLMIEFLLM